MLVSPSILLKCPGAVVPNMQILHVSLIDHINPLLKTPRPEMSLSDNADLPTGL